MSRAIYAGSFDPFHYGHLRVLKEAAQIFDIVIPVILVNSTKTRRFDAGIMRSAIDRVLKDEVNFRHVLALSMTGLLSDIAKRYDVSHSVRGLRNSMDYASEENMAKINEQLGLKTLYLRSGDLDYISSSMVMELSGYGKDVSKYVPEQILKLIQEDDRWKVGNKNT